MNLLTHALFGAAIGELMLGKQLGNRALAWGALGGVALYLDAVITPFFHTATKLWWHQGPSHSLVFVIIISLLLAKPLAKFWKREKISPQRAGAFVFFVLVTHVLLDCMKPSGVAVFWPLPIDRIAFGNLSTFDPLLTLPLLVCMMWLAFLRKPKQRPKRMRLLGWGIGLSGCYLAFTVAMKFMTTTGFDADLAERGVADEKRLVIPTSLNSLVWRAVVDRGDALWVGHRSVFQKRSTPVRWIVYPRGGSAAEHFASESEVLRIQSTTGGYWIARAHNRGLWIADLRTGELREFGKRDSTVDHRMACAWNFEPDAAKDRVIPVPVDLPGFFPTLRKTGQQIFGRDEGAEMAPRLAGVPGQFPEPLMVVD